MHSVRTGSTQSDQARQGGNAAWIEPSQRCRSERFTDHLKPVVARETAANVTGAVENESGHDDGTGTSRHERRTVAAGRDARHEQDGSRLL